MTLVERMARLRYILSDRDYEGREECARQWDEPDGREWREGWIEQTREMVELAVEDFAQFAEREMMLNANKVRRHYGIPEKDDY